MGVVCDSHAYDCAEQMYTDAEIDAALQAAPWQSETHSHDNYGEHTHENAFREVELPAGCWHAEYAAHDHPEPDPEPEPASPPVVEGYTPPVVSTCIAGPCLNKENPNQVLGPLDLEGNKPPEPEPGEEIYYPTVTVDGVSYWDSSRPPYKVPNTTQAEEIPAGYKLEEINGESILVPFDPDAVDVDTETTLTIYYRVEVVGGRDYLQPVPVDVYPANGAGDGVTNTGVGPQGNQQSQGSQGNQQSQDAEDPENSQGGASEAGGSDEIYASASGKYYQITLNPPRPLQVTEYMVDSWGNGQKKLPQWIEVYNPNTLAVSLRGYELSYVFKKQTHVVQLRHFIVPPKGAIILATHIPHQRYRYEGITASEVYNLEIENGLKQGWLLTDHNGEILSQTGKIFGATADPIKPERVGMSRVSYNIYESERTRDTYFFGFRKDISSPGFHEPRMPRSPALLRRKLTTTWASFKKK